MFTNNKGIQLKFDHTAKLVTLGIALLENTVNRKIFAELNFHSLNPMKEYFCGVLARSAMVTLKIIIIKEVLIFHKNF